MLPPAKTRVLVVDDDQDYLILINDLLHEGKRAYFEVTQAQSAQEALIKVKKQRFDVILLDYRLSDMTGLDLMEEIWALHFKIPIVIVTSHGDRKLQNEAIERGVADFLEKGKFTAELLEKTCLYAIGLNERRIKQTEPAGVGTLVQELVGLTRESVTAQSQMAHGVQELRSDMKEQVKEIRSDIAGVRDHADKHRDDILRSFPKGYLDRVRDAINWIVDRPLASIIIFIGLIFLIMFITFLIKILGAENLKVIKDAIG